MKRWIATGLPIVAAFQLWAQAPDVFRYQGRLVNGTNPVNATVPISFKLYDALSGGNKLYEGSTSVLVVNGLYSAYIGDNTVFGSLTNAPTHAAVYLELTVNGATLSPRERLVSVPYTLSAPSSTAIGGDPTAVSNVVVTARWIKNIYANGDITMSDKETGLMWLYNANPCGDTNWEAAVSYCTNLTYAGHSDWRLPRMAELHQQFDSLDFFAGVQDGGYWSGASGAGNAWYVNMGNGYVDDDDAPSFFVWPVRVRLFSNIFVLVTTGKQQ